MSSIRPHAFETAVALNAFAIAVSGLFGLTQWSIVLHFYLPGWLATLTDVSYMVGGAMVLLGLLRSRSHIELAGLFLLGSAAVARMFISWAAVLQFGAPVYLSMSLFHLFLALGCAGRIHSIVSGERIVVFTNGDDCE